MKQQKNMLSLFGKMLLLLLVLTAILPGTAVCAKTRLSKTSARLSVGGRVTLKVKGSGKKVTWSVSGKKLVTITTKGKKRQTAVIRAGKKTGSCFVIAKAGKKQLRCRITVKKKAPAGGTPEEPTPITPPDHKVTDSTVLALADTSLKLAKEACAQNPAGTNCLLSPQSILTALALAENGAAGSTLSEMERAVGGLPVGTLTSSLTSMDKKLSLSKAVIYQTANSVWYREGKISLKDSYLNSAKSLFGADVYSAPFDGSTVKRINSWVAEKTKNKITKIIDRLDPSVLTVLINAIYFKGQWAEQYSKKVSRTFTDYAGNASTVPMLEGTESTYVTLGGAEGFVKYYGSGGVAFLALLPPAGQTAAAFLNTVSGEDFVKAYVNRVNGNMRVHTRMPEFECEYEIRLNALLQKLGIRLAFSDMADFSKMADKPLKIDEVLHKTYIKVDQYGTEAAAVTAMTAKATSVLPMKLTEKWVYLDRPFVYALVDTDTGLPLFIGTIEKVK